VGEGGRSQQQQKKVKVWAQMREQK
jgi:hypothetical protein